MLVRVYRELRDYEFFTSRYASLLEVAIIIENFTNFSWSRRRIYRELQNKLIRFIYLYNMKTYYVYILECADGTYYTGVTNDIERRLYEHISGQNPESYTSKRRPVKLVWYTETNDINFALEKEKQIKKWSKAKKNALINEDWENLILLAKKTNYKN